VPKGLLFIPLIIRVLCRMRQNLIVAIPKVLAESRKGADRFNDGTLFFVTPDS
jgi:hypothetical protein